MEVAGGETAEEPPEPSAATPLGRGAADPGRTRPVTVTAERNEESGATLP